MIHQSPNSAMDSDTGGPVRVASCASSRTLDTGRRSGLGAHYALSTGHDRSGAFVDEFMGTQNTGRGAISHHCITPLDQPYEVHRQLAQSPQNC